MTKANRREIISVQNMIRKNYPPVVGLYDNSKKFTLEMKKWIEERKRDDIIANSTAKDIKLELAKAFGLKQDFIST